MRSISIGCLAAVHLLGGCFEDSTPMDDDAAGSSSSPASMGTMATPPPSVTTAVTTMSTEPDDTGTMGATSVEPTTTTTPTRPDTGADSTTMAVSATDSGGSSESSGCVPACDGIACGLEPVCMTLCGECGVSATCSEDQNFCAEPLGNSNDFGDVWQIPAGLQFGHRFSVFVPRTVRRLGIIAGGAGPVISLALYSHDGAGPADRLAQITNVALEDVGANEFDIGATDIGPGDYWVLLHTSGFTPLGRTFNGDQGYETALRSGIPFNDGFPAFMDDEEIRDDYNYNIYVVVEE